MKKQGGSRAEEQEGRKQRQGAGRGKARIIPQPVTTPYYLPPAAAFCADPGTGGAQDAPDLCCREQLFLALQCTDSFFLVLLPSPFRVSPPG